MNALIGWLPVVAALALVGVSVQFVRPRAPRAFLFLAGAGGLEAVYGLLSRVVKVPFGWALSPLVWAGAVLLLFIGIFALMDALYPAQTTRLPGVLGTSSFDGPNLVLRLFFGGFAILAGVSSTIRFSGLPMAIVGALGPLGLLLGQWFFERRSEPLEQWVLSHRPDLVVWAYTHQLTMMRNGSFAGRTFSVRMGLSTGEVLPVAAGANTEQGAQEMLASIAMHCPGIALGYSEANLQKFKSDAGSMRRLDVQPMV